MCGKCNKYIIMLIYAVQVRNYLSQEQDSSSEDKVLFLGMLKEEARNSNIWPIK